MRLTKKYWCPHCFKGEWVEGLKSGETCSKCLNKRYLIDVWIAEGKWIEVKTEDGKQYIIPFKKGGE